MKKKPSKKRSKIPAKKSRLKTASTVGSPTPAEVTSVQPRTPFSMPPPDALFREAEGEPDFRALSAYADSIGMLRDKGFSYREIADWFSERGIDVDHNAVYRVYTNSLSDYEAHLEDLREAEDAEQEARRKS